MSQPAGAVGAASGSREVARDRSITQVASRLQSLPDMKTIERSQLAAISGGIDWRHSLRQGADYGEQALGYGAFAGAAIGLVGGVPGAVLGAQAGAVVGGLAGAAYGIGRGVIETWRE
jgi:hypothetical protein